MGYFGGYEGLRYDPDDLSASLQHGIGERSHPADMRPTEDDAEIPSNQLLSEISNPCQVLRSTTRVAATKDADGSHEWHFRPCGDLSQRIYWDGRTV